MEALIPSEGFGQLIRALTLLLLGLPLVWLLSRLFARIVKRRISEHYGLVVGKAVFYAGFLLIFATVLSQLGFKLGALLSAAGIAGIAVGFAAQTSLSNVISGLFLLTEKPFATGDLIQVGSQRGVVLSVDLLSVKIRTLDNTFVRIPNESLVKSELTNITRFPIRRMDIVVGVAYKEDPQRVMDVLQELATSNRYCLDEPEPLILFKDFGDSALLFTFGVWFQKANYVVLRNSLLMDIKVRFDKEGIEIPFPHRTLYMGEVSKPFSVKVDAAEPAKRTGMEMGTSDSGPRGGG